MGEPGERDYLNRLREAYANRRTEQWAVLTEVGSLVQLDGNIATFAGRARLTLEVDVPLDALARLFPAQEDGRPDPPRRG